jgi:hypothetical protein
MLELIYKDSVFVIFAYLGSFLFAVQFLLSLFGVEGSEEAGGGDFKWLSKQALSGFAMMFGWIGLTCIREFNLGPAASALIAVAGGLIAFFVTGLLFRGAKGLRSAGSVFKIEDTLGKEATVYHRIRKESPGKITISVHDLTHEIDAISPGDEELPSFCIVRVIGIQDDKTVIVEQR